MSAAAKKIETQPEMTLEAFLDWDGGGHVGKLELWEGRVRAMAPASATHGFIQGNIVTAFNIHLRARKSPCRAGTEGPIVPPMGMRRNARAPDVSVTCKPPGDDKLVVDPVLIVEVLSPSNEHETWESIRSLSGLMTLQEVLVVRSTRVDLALYRRDPVNGWPSKPEVANKDGSVHLASIGLTLTPFDVYQGTYLE
jgi:Uma2 family endonuclease